MDASNESPAGNRKAINPLWRLADTLTVYQAAALIAGVDPNRVRIDSFGDPWVKGEGTEEIDPNTEWVRTAFAAMVNAINAGTLPATIRRDARLGRWDELPNIGEEMRPISHEEADFVIYREAPDWSKTTVAVSNLVAWLESRGVRTGFFFPKETSDVEYLDPQNPRYAPKLAAAVKAWLAVTDTGGNHPKKALAKWLREHAAEFGLTDDDGKPNETAIEEISKVCNWQPTGGAPRTPGG